MVHNKIKISKLSLVLVMIYFMTFVDIAYMESYNLIKYCFIVLTGLYISQYISVFKNKNYFKINILLVAFVALVLGLAIFNVNTINTRNPLLAAIVFSAILIEMFLVIQHASSQNQMSKVINVFYYCSLFVTIATDLYMLFFHQGGSYLIGTKFQVVYMHCYLLVFFIMKYKFNFKKNIIAWISYILFVSFIVYISVRVGSGTGLLCVFFYSIILILMSTRFKTVFCKSLNYFAVLLGSTLFFILYEIIISIPFIENIIVNVLGKSLALTGRAEIYTMVQSVLNGHILTGYGYGSAYEVSVKYMGYANTQNGIINWILEVGIVATIIMVFIFVFVFNKVNKNKNLDRRIFPAIALIFMFNIICAIEVPINLAYFTWMAIILGFASSNLNLNENTNILTNKKGK